MALAVGVRVLWKVSDVSDQCGAYLPDGIELTGAERAESRMSHQCGLS